MLNLADETGYRRYIDIRPFIRISTGAASSNSTSSGRTCRSSILKRDKKKLLGNYEYNNDVLRYLWKTIMIISSENAMNITQKLILALHEYVTTQLLNYPMTEASHHLQTLLNNSRSPTAQTSIEIFNEYLVHTQVKPLFYRLLLHPGVTEEQLQHFMSPICQLARELPDIELVVFFDEVNTSSYLGLFTQSNSFTTAIKNLTTCSRFNRFFKDH
jgi:hypothetical protein